MCDCVVCRVEEECWVKALKDSQAEGRRNRVFGASCVTRRLGGSGDAGASCASIPGFQSRESLTSSNRRHGVSHEGFVCLRVCLHVRRHYLGVFSEIASERFALPSAFGFDDVEGDPL